MQRTTVLVALLAGFSLVLAGEVMTCPPSGQDNPWFHAPSPTTPVDDGTSNGAAVPFEPGEVDYGMITGSPGPGLHGDDIAARVTPFIDWGNDTLIGRTSTVPAWGKISTDADGNGNQFVGVLDPSGTNEDTVSIWRSSDAGRTWNRFLRIIAGTATGGIDDYVLRVGTDANGVWVYHFCLYNSNTTDGGLWVLRHRYPFASSHWAQVVQRGDTLLNIAADRNMETPEHLFVGYQTTSNNVYMYSSKDTAQTWGNFTYITNNRRQPAVCAGSDKYVYCAAMTVSDSTYFRIGRNDNNLEPGGNWVFVNPHTDPNRRYRELSIAADRDEPGPTQTAICLAIQTYVPNGNIYTYYGWTRDGGATWNASYWPPTNQARTTWNYHDPYIRRSYHDPVGLFRAVVSGPEPSQSWDTLVYAYARDTSPTNWEARDTPNDHQITSEYGARIDYSQKNLGGYIVYRQYGEDSIWFDGYTYSGVAEGRTPAPPRDRPKVTTVLGNGTALNLSLAGPTEVRATLFDGVGRYAGVVYDGRLEAGEHRLPIPAANLAEGIYFLSLDLDGRTQTAKLVHVR